MNYNKDYKHGGFKRRDSPREMFKAVCDNCGKDCEVPFEPTSGKPVFCHECFEKKNENSRSTRSRSYSDRGPRRSSSRPGYSRSADSPPQNSEQLAEIINKLDQILKVITPPPLTEDEKKEKKKEVIAKALGKKKSTKKAKK